MKFTVNWLKNYMDVSGLSPQEIADHLTMLGLEVDSVEPLFANLADLKTGLVVSAEPHPNADKLTLCQVRMGDETHQIVCGAPNVRKDLMVVVALPGAVLPGDFKITASKIRGVKSGGMICSERELGLSNNHDGIMELDPAIGHGQPFLAALSLEDTFIEVDLTPNRPDCASVIGIAREMGGVVKKTLTLPVKDAKVATEAKDFQVEIANPELCPRYAARLIKGVKIGPSPWWLKKRLLSVGLRPINNIVDITNFVMLEYGQPLHAFDFDTLAGGRIVVRTPRDAEVSFTTLDNSPRKLDSDMLLICDGEKPVALAGIMGGLNSEVTGATTNILLESACFNPVSIRKTARRVNLATDASYRFERGVDPDGAVNALDRAVQLICELSGATLPTDGIDRFPGKKELTKLNLRVSRTCDLLGITLDAREIGALLEGIGINCGIQNDETLTVTVPSFRVDIEREADLIEEVARLYGYDNIPTTLPLVNLSYPEQETHRTRRLDLARQLVGYGFTEAINYSFITEKYPEMMNLPENDPRTPSVRLLNPLSEDQAVLRTMLLPGLLDNVRRNINFQKTAIRMFEIGKVFTPTSANAQPIERTRLAGMLVGSRFGENSPLYYKPAPVDIFDAKGVVEYIIRTMELATDAQNLRLIPAPAGKDEPFAQPGYSLNLVFGEQQLGSIGKISENVVKNFNIKHEIYFFDLDYDSICALPMLTKAFTSLPVYPSVKRDIALVVPDYVSAGEMLEMIGDSGDKLIERFDIFDVFKGDKIPAGHKSVALTITYRSQTKTLTEKNVEKSHSKIVSILTDKFGGSLRNA